MKKDNKYYQWLGSRYQVLKSNESFFFVRCKDYYYTLFLSFEEEEVIVKGPLLGVANSEIDGVFKYAQIDIKNGDYDWSVRFDEFFNIDGEDYLE